MALSNSQYDAIMRVYNQRQFQDKREQDKRIAEVYEKVPQVEALSDEIAATMAQAARKILAGDRAAADQLLPQRWNARQVCRSSKSTRSRLPVKR